MVVADLFPSGRFLRALMHVLGVAAIIQNGRDRERDHTQAEEEDEHHAQRAGEKPHAGVVLVEDGQRDEHAGKDDGKMREYIPKFSHVGGFLSKVRSVQSRLAMGFGTHQGVWPPGK